MPSKKPSMLCRTNEETKVKIELIAKKEHRSTSNLIEIILEKYIQDYEKNNGVIEQTIINNGVIGTQNINSKN